MRIFDGASQSAQRSSSIAHDPADDAAVRGNPAPASNVPAQHDAGADGVATHSGSAGAWPGSAGAVDRRVSAAVQADPGTRTDTDVTHSGGADAGASVSGAASQAQQLAHDAVANAIDRLDHDGDRVVLGVTLEGKLEVPVPLPPAGEPVGVGGKAQYGYTIAVEQVGGAGSADGAAPHYEVKFDKNLLAGVMAEIPAPVLDPAAEINLRTTDSATMSFATKEEALRAVEILERVAASQTLRDAASVAVPGASQGGNPASNPVGGDETSSTPGGTNGSSASGAGGPLAPAVDSALAGIAPSQQDMDWLNQHVTSYSTRIGAQERLKLGVKLVQLGIEPRFDAQPDITRTVTLPHDGQPGRVTYTLGGELAVSTKTKFTIGLGWLDINDVGYKPADIAENARLRGEISLSWDVPASDFAANGGRPAALDVADLLSGNGRAPDEASVRLRAEVHPPTLLDPTRTDLLRTTIEASVTDPVHNSVAALDRLVHGDVDGAQHALADHERISVTAERVQRDGVNQQHELGFEIADLFEGGVSAIVDVGFDDIVQRRTVTLDGSQPAPAPGSDDGSTPPPTPAGAGQYVVVPRDGVNVRTEPSVQADRASVIQHGSFVQATGQQQVDAQGRTWFEVSGTDVADRPVSGWVASDYLSAHPQGAMDATGRVNPALEAAGQNEYTVQPGDNLWDIARAKGADFGTVLALNQDHLIDPALIFPGDTVYLPGQHAVPTPPVPETPPSEPPPPADPSDPSLPPSTGSGSTGSGTTGSGTTGSGSATGSGSTGSGTGSQPTDSGPVQETVPTPPADQVPPVVAPGGRRDLAEILQQYQVPDEPTVTFRPDVSVGPFEVGVPFVSQNATRTEAALLDRLSLGELYDLKNLKDGAFATANEFYPPAGGPNDFHGTNDGHNDAFRHAYVSAMLARRFGPEYAEALMTAHEGVTGNEAQREAMDLYNNEVGRSIAAANPNASDAEIAQLVYQAVQSGQTVVIDGQRNLAWSDQVAVGSHGHPLAADQGGLVLPGQIQPRGDADPTRS